jgi:hypothetical protein
MYEPVGPDDTNELCFHSLLQKVQSSYIRTGAKVEFDRLSAVVTLAQSLTPAVRRTLSRSRIALVAAGLALLGEEGSCAGVVAGAGGEQGRGGSGGAAHLPSSSGFQSSSGSLSSHAGILSTSAAGRAVTSAPSSSSLSVGTVMAFVARAQAAIPLPTQGSAEGYQVPRSQSSPSSSTTAGPSGSGGRAGPPSSSSSSPSGSTPQPARSASQPSAPSPSSLRARPDPGLPRQLGALQLGDKKPRGG